MRIVKTTDDLVISTIVEGEGDLGKKISAYFLASGGFVLELKMTTGFSHTETSSIFWTAPNTEGYRGMYAT